jgi:hypothetical protein
MSHSILSKLNAGDKKQVVKLLDAFIELRQFKRKAEART